MRFLPFENFYITTKLSPEDAQSRLQQEVGPAVSIFRSNAESSTGYFSGFVVNQQFEFRKNINYRNSFLPKISGTITKDLYGSKIHVKMRPYSFVIIFMIIWLSATFFAGVAFLTFAILKNSFTAGHLIPLGMFLFGYGLATGSFKFESIRSKEKLIELVSGEAES